MIVKATREGLIGQRTASGWLIDTTTPYVALPSDAALRQRVVVANLANGKSIRAIVLDVGPWNIHDTPYVFGGSRPQAESGTDHFGRKTNGAGIDLGEVVWAALGMADSKDGKVNWEFLP